MTGTILPPYTSTYTDVDHSIMDSDDLVAEFWRVSYFINLWGGAIDVIGSEENYEAYVELVEGSLADILPSNGLIQRIEVAADVSSFVVKVNEHLAGDPFRVFIILRCLNKDTRFTLSVPSGETHKFGVNRSEYMPSQVIADGFYSAFITCTYGSENGVMVQVMAANPEEALVDYDDVMTATPK